MDIFQPDTVLAPQFFATLRRQAPNKKGEWQLIIAVLEDAIYCYQKYLFAKDRSGQRLFREACDWMMTPRPRSIRHEDDAPNFSFEYICDVLGIDPDYLRQGLLRWRDEQLAKGLKRVLSDAGSPVPTTQHSACFELPVAMEAAGGGGLG